MWKERKNNMNQKTKKTERFNQAKKTDSLKIGKSHVRLFIKREDSKKIKKH